MSYDVRVKLVTPATEDPVKVTEAKLWMKQPEEETAEDAVIEAMIATAVRRFEEFHNRALLNQIFDAYCDEAPASGDPFEVPRAPLVSIGSIKGFTDTDATDTGGTAMNSTGYYVDTASEPGRVVPIGGATYPTATRIVNAFIVRFTAGYSTSTTGVPEEAKTIVKQMVAAAYEHRGDEQGMEEAMNDVLHQSNYLALPEWG